MKGHENYNLFFSLNQAALLIYKSPYYVDLKLHNKLYGYF